MESRKLLDADIRVVEGESVLPGMKPKGKPNHLGPLYIRMHALKVGSFAVLPAAYVKRYDKPSTLGSKIRKELRDRRIGSRWYIALATPQFNVQDGDMIIVRTEYQEVAKRKLGSLRSANK